MKQLTSKVFNSVMTRLALIVGAMGIMIGIMVFVSWTVFQSIAVQMQEMSEKKLPQLRAGSQVTTATDETRALLSEILIATTQEDVKALHQKNEAVLTGFRAALANLPPEQRTSAEALLTDAQQSLLALLQAREDEQVAELNAAETLKAAFANASAVSARLEEASDDALFEMTISGETATTSIDQTLTNLVEEDFAKFQAVLGIQSEVNLLTGLGMGLQNGRASTTRAIVEDLALSSISRLKTLLALIDDAPSLEDVSKSVRTSLETYERAFGGNGFVPSANDIAQLRLKIDGALSPAVDDVYFNLIIGSEEAKETSQAALMGLLKTEVAAMRQMAVLDAATKSYFSNALKIALSRDRVDLDLARASLAESESAVRALVDEKSSRDIVDEIEKLLALGQPETGIADMRARVFAAQEAAGIAANEASRAVTAIARETTAFSTDSVNSIQQTAEALGARVDAAGRQVSQIGLAGLIFVLVAPLFVWALVTRPLNKVTQVTERLANGDLSEIKGLKQNEGELGRLARALFVFRQNEIKSIEMREEEKRREQLALEEERAAEIARQAETEAQKKREKEQDEAARALAEAGRKKMISDLSASLGKVVNAASKGDFSQRVNASFDDDELVGLANNVNTLVGNVQHGVDVTGQALRRVAEGDLTELMQGDFHGAFKDLQSNTNDMINALKQLIGNISNSTVNLSASSNELRETSDALSKQAEQNAASLEETSAALDELTTSIKQVSGNVDEANSNAGQASETAKTGSAVAADAADAMNRISDASKEIAKVVTVINDISFQINLLALNAGVEAARAGEAGRGFSVVASEVRQLAQRAGDAATEIDDVIARSDQAVALGVEKVNDARESLEQIVQSAHGVSERIEQVSLAISEQVSGVAEINSSVAQIDGNTQKQAAAFEEVTATSAMLSQEAEGLKKSTTRFKTHIDEEGKSNQAVAQLRPTEPKRPTSSSVSFGNLAEDRQGWSDF